MHDNEKIYRIELTNEEYEFLDIVQKGEQEEIKNALSRNLKKYFNRYIGGFS